MKIGVLIIGNEILSAQIKDENLAYILPKINELGYSLSEVRIVGDEIQQISKSFQDLSDISDVVISSGGVGPTHDDVTLKALALSQNDKLAENAELIPILRHFFGNELSEGAVRMAEVPEKSEIIQFDKESWPIIKSGNCYVMPGVPSIFRKKCDKLLESFPKGNVVYSASLWVSTEEISFAEKLNEIQKSHASVQIGSYPKYSDKHIETEISIKSPNLKQLSETYNELFIWFKHESWLIRFECAHVYHPYST